MGSTSEPYSVCAIKLLHPLYNSPRIVAQAGGFTFHSNPRISIDKLAGKEFQDEKLDIEHLVKWTIPHEKKHKILLELDDLGINRRTMFPEIEGLATGLWHSIVLRSGK